ncbi:MAG: aromatic ring-hydroxylating oxygenase subunit alpha [Polyangiaceae bacterium]
MNPASHVELARRLLRNLKANRTATERGRTALVKRSRYVSPERFALERKHLLATTPQIVAHESELAEPGACMTVDVAGVSLLVVRGPDGEVRAFRNACRHRSTELVPQDAPCRKKAFVCRYHGWTYDLTGKRIHVPHQPSFAGLDADRDALAPAHARVHSGFVWASLAPFEPAAHLGALDQEIATLNFGAARVHARASLEVRANWKLIVDAFLDGYHIRHLHRDTVYRFFFDAQSEAEPVGLHIRAATARRTLAEANENMLENAPIRELVTPSYSIFPNTILVLHPDYTSLMRMDPLAVDRTRFVHTMLVDGEVTPEKKAHFDKSFALIHDGVFVREDLAIVQSIQRGMESSADETMLFGELEYAAKWFHDAVDSIVDG